MFEIKESNSKVYNLSLIAGRGFFRLLIAGIIIGLLHEYDWVVAAFCLLRLVYFVFIDGKKKYNKETLMILNLGMLITCVFGVLIEKFGIHSDYWVYHDLTNGRTFPYWLPMSWALSFLFLYRIEERVVQVMSPSVFQKVLIIILSSLIFPTFGEIVTIHLGVWTYDNLGAQFFGVPYLAMIALIILHSLVYIWLAYLCRRKKIKTTVFDY